MSAAFGAGRQLGSELREPRYTPSMQRPQTLRSGVELFSAKTPTLPPATETNSYALGEREVLLVEPATPYPDEQRAWLNWAGGIRSRGQTLIAIVLTHHHPDHAGGAQALAAALDLPVWAHVETARRLPGLTVARELNDGELLTLAGPTPQVWQVLHTPGHAPGHVCLWEARTRQLLAGDMVSSVSSILIEPEDGDMSDYLEQLERLSALDSELLLPAHGPPVREPAALLRRTLSHRREREQRVLDALGPDPVSFDTLLSRVYNDVPAAVWSLSRLSLEAHLVKLQREGSVENRLGSYLRTATEGS